MTQRPGALVTGAGRRLGRLIAETLSDTHDLVIHHNNSGADAEAFRDALAAQGRNAVTFQADLGRLEARYDDLVAVFRHNDVRVVVNSASVFEHDTMDDARLDSLFRHAAINCFAPVLLIRALAETLPEGAEGTVVNILDHKLFNLNPDHLTYTLSKASLAAVTEMAARAYAPRIRCNGVAPGYSLPAPGQDQADFDRIKADSPLGRGTDPVDIAHTVRFLVDVRSVTGEVIVVDSGERLVSRERDYSFR